MILAIKIIFALLLLVIGYIDFKYYLILDKIVYPAIIIVFIINLFLGFGIWSLILGSIFGGGFFFIQYLLTQAKGIGLGDSKLGILLGVMLGWESVILCIFIAYMIGGVVALFLLVFKKKKMTDRLPLAVFLSLAGIIVLFWGEYILNFVI